MSRRLLRIALLACLLAGVLAAGIAVAFASLQSAGGGTGTSETETETETETGTTTGETDTGTTTGETSPPGPAAIVAVPADDVVHPGSLTEWWYAHAVDPRTGRVVIVSFFTAPLPVAGGFLYTPNRMTDWRAFSAQEEHDGPGVALAAGGIGYDDQADTWTVDQTAAGYRVHLVLSRTKPGVTAGPLRFGSEDMSWTVPVATARADGWVITPEGRRITIRGWRGYHDHNWGAFSLESSQNEGWEWAVSHEPGGKAWVLGGIRQLGGAFDGVLSRVERGSTKSCEPKLRLTRWTQLDRLRFPTKVRATCAGRTVVFRVTRPYVVTLTTHGLTESVGRTSPGSLALIEHLAALQP